MQREPRHVLSHVGIYLVARGLPGVVAFLAIPLFTRLLEPADYGRYALVIAVVNLLNALLFQWLRLSLVRYLPAQGNDPARLKSTLAAAALALILVAGAAAAAACLLPVARGWEPVVAACWAVLSVHALFELACEHARAAIRPWYYMALQLARSGAALALGAGLLLAGAGWLGPLVGMAAGMGLAVAYAARRDWRDVRPAAVDRRMLGDLLRYGVPLSLTVALAVVVSSSDRFLIAWLLGDDAAGLYAVAADFTAQTLILLMTVVSLAAFPMAVRAWEQGGPEAARPVMRTNASVLLALAVPSVVGMSVLAPGVAHCFFGAGYRAAAADLIPLVALGTLIAGLKAFHFDAAFQFAHQTIHQVWIVLVVAVVNVGLSLLAIPWWGIAGAAAASVLAYAVSLALTVALGRRYFAVPFPGTACAQVLLASAAMALVLYPLRSHLAAWALAGQVTVGVAVYGFALASVDFMGLRSQAWRRWRARAVPAVAPAANTIESAPAGMAGAAALADVR